MNITVEKQPECRATIRVEVPREKVDSHRSEITKAYHRQANIPGFRPGKAPLAMIARRFAKAIEDELNNRLYSAGYQEGLKQEGLSVLTALDIKDSKTEEDGRFTYTIHVLTAPDFELPNYKGFTLKVPKSEIKDEDLEKAIDNIRERLAEYPDIDGRDLQENDVAVINYHGFIDGKPIREVVPGAPEQLFHGHEFWLKVVEPNFLAGFCGQLVGMKKGETKQIKITLPADFPIKDVAEKEVSYDVELVNLKEQKLPDVDDAFVQKIQGGDDVAAFRDNVRKRLEQEMTARLEQSKAEQIVGLLNEAVNFPMPKEYIDNATMRRANELVTYNQRQGVPIEMIKENQQQILAAANEQAAFDVKTNFILSKIAQAEDITVANEEISREILMNAMRNGQSEKEAVKAAKNSEVVNRVRDQIVIRKVIEIIKASAVIEEVEPGQEEAETTTEGTPAAS